MRIDKFGVGSFIVGTLMVLGILHFFFMDGVWSTSGLVTALVVTIQGGLILLGIFLVIIGLLLLWL